MSAKRLEQDEAAESHCPGQERVLRFVLLAFAFSVPLSIAIAEPLLFLAFPVWLYGVIRRRDGSLFRNPYFWPILTFAVIAIMVSASGVRPEVSLRKSHRLLFPFIVFMMPAVLDERGAGKAAMLFTIACALRGLYQVVYVPVQVARGVSLYDTGNMRDPQMYLVALCLLLAGLIRQPWFRRKLLALLVAVSCAAGLILNFKRGAWFAFLVASAVMSATGRRVRILGAAALCVVLLLLLPQTRARLGMLHAEWSRHIGGRYVLWTEIAPVMLEHYPGGMGLEATRHEDFLRHAPDVQPGLDHLHNNILQIRLELGVPGLLAWGWWMLTAFGVMLHSGFVLRARPGPLSWLAIGSLGAFVGLMANGIVEYNFGDSEILMLLSFVLGLSAVVWPYARRQGSESGG